MVGENQLVSVTAAIVRTGTAVISPASDQAAAEKALPSSF